MVRATTVDQIPKKTSGQPTNQGQNPTDNQSKLGGGIRVNGTRNKNPNIRCNNCNGFGHFGRECPSVKRSDPFCYECGKPGHMRNQCRRNANRQNRDQPTIPNQYRGQPVQPLMNVQTGIPTYYQVQQPPSVTNNQVPARADNQGTSGTTPNDGAGRAVPVGRGDGAAAQQQQAAN